MGSELEPISEEEQERTNRLWEVGVATIKPWQWVLREARNGFENDVEVEEEEEEDMGVETTGTNEAEIAIINLSR